MSSYYLKFRIGIPHHYIRTAQERQGIIEFYNQIDVYDILINKSKFNTIKPYNITTGQQFTKLCLLDIPSNMIPNEIIRFFHTSIDSVSSISIYRHNDYAQKYLGIIELKNNTAAIRFIEQYQNILLSSIDDCYCFLYPVKKVAYSIDINHNSDIFNCDTNTTTAISSLNSMIIKNNEYDKLYNHTSNYSIDNNPLSALIVSRGPSPHNIQQYQHQPLQRKLSHDEMNSFNHSFLPIISHHTYEEDNNNANSNRYITMKNECDTSNHERSLISPDTIFINCDEEFCSVCLDTINKIHPMSFTTCCSHTFHIQCISQLERPQCPVCRFQHDDITITMNAKNYTCFDCGWYDLSSINDNEHQTFKNSNSSNSSRSNSKISSNYQDETSLKPNSSIDNTLLNSINTTTATTTTTSTTTTATSELYPSNNCHGDLWICLVCGFTGCGVIHLGHIRTHYENTLHTYAMNTDTRQVWDFAGDGYVHKLILNTPITTTIANRNYSDDVDNKSEIYYNNNYNVNDSSNFSMNNNDSNTTTNIHNTSITNNITSTNIILENHSQQQLTQQEQESLIINHKLEIAAYNYNQILAWQMEQNRILYMTRVQRIRDSAGMISNTITTIDYHINDISSSNSNVNNKNKHELTLHMNEKNWRDNMIISLKSEKIKLLKQVENVKERVVRNIKEQEVIKELNKSLRKNQIEWEQRLQLANDLYSENENTLKHQKYVLECKVNELMTKLDEVQRTDTGRKYTNNNNPTTSPGT